MKEYSDQHIGLRTRVRFALDACSRMLVAAPKFENLDAWIVSPGGVGTTFLIEHVRRFKSVNDPYDGDELKHWPKPPTKRLSSARTRVLFILGDPHDIALSLERRQWLRFQARKLGSPAASLAEGRFQNWMFRRAVSRQIASWQSARVPAMMFVEYHSLWDQVELIAEHFRITDPRFVADFPAWKPRKSTPSRN